MTEWQPIETAPKDGTDILAYNQNRNAFYIAKWHKWSDKKAWVSAFGRVKLLPTHWMPLPEPPK